MKRLLLILMVTLSNFRSNAQKTTLPSSSKNKSVVLDPVSVDPSFPGGQKAFYKFLSKNLKYPEKDRETYGTVIINFFIEKDGSLTGIKVAKSLSPDLDAEALRVIKKSPKWIPAMKNHKPVKVQYKVPINFIFSE